LTLKLYDAGVGSVWPAATARTAKVCLPTLSLSTWPELHAVNALPSMLHWKVAPAVAEANSNATDALLLDVVTFFFGVLVSVVSGTTGGGGAAAFCWT